MSQSINNTRHSDMAIQQLYELKTIQDETNTIDNKLLSLRQETINLVEIYKNEYGCKNYKLLLDRIKKDFSHEINKQTLNDTNKKTAIKNIRDYLESIKRDKVDLEKINFALATIDKNYI